jgi:ATP-binding cassette subfamily B multidrug efflux pump
MTKYQFIMHYLLLNKYSYLFAVACIFIVNWLLVEIPRYIQQAIDLLNVASNSPPSLLVDNVQAVIFLSLLMIMVRILSRIYALNPGRRTEMALKNDLFNRLNLLPRTFHNQHAPGKLISIINNDLNGIRVFYSLGFLHVFNILFAFSLTPLWMWQISPKLTLYSIIPILIGFVFFRIGFRQLRQLQAQRLIKLQNLSEQLINYLSGIDLIKTEQMGLWASQKIENINHQLFLCTLQITRIQTFVMPIIDYANQLMKVLILGLGGYFVLQSELTIGEITAFLSYSVLLAVPLMSLGRIMTVYQMGMVSIDSIQSILNSSIPKQDQINLNAPQRKKLQNKGLRVINLSYSYQIMNDNEYTQFNQKTVSDQDTKLALNNISFTIEPGKKVGILGSIGSGKSTLVNCLNHHLDVAPGHIFWGDTDITQLSRHDLRSFIRTITQNAYLFSDTIERNVRFGSTKSSKILNIDHVNQVLKISQLNDDIRSFSNKEQTIVGEKGIMLSGGQKQRLSIARALLTPSDLIIMDNVLSAVDYETERNILKAVFHHINKKSLLIVSHRISALENMDEILVIEEGNIIARGTHSQLLATSRYYRETWELQHSLSTLNESPKAGEISV